MVRDGDLLQEFRVEGEQIKITLTNVAGEAYYVEFNTDEARAFIGSIEEQIEKLEPKIPELFFVIDLNIHDLYSGDEGFPPKGEEPLYWYLIGPFDTEEAASDWGNRNLSFFGTTALPITDPRDYEDL